MPWNLSSDRPIFLQIVERIEMDIISGVYQPGQRSLLSESLPPVQPSIRTLCKEPFPNSKEPA